ncbi:HLH-domain-containing protein [Basidiobolus meristosporus CBS 931.73]|uniref:HLH-domain-containing protein n=1 Tax=Basidiobolus meristosporus CBS 931.73 TaxID=1314790 RepID=A0A1Y1XP45_9FUNG|nr:HLH-domain-containing protein [Basidiobolus meristosporus CBS 931.73]|eukprot:ORX87517.1 HLH-domain-containing protein [Basidiobolus meristosporus CBS 931.73]
MSFPANSANSPTQYIQATHSTSLPAVNYMQTATPPPPVNNMNSISSPASAKPPADKNSLQSKIISRKLKGYLFEDSIREFNPEKLYKTKESRKREIYKVQGVNLLNRDDIDSKTAIERLQKRRAQHNRVERRRRDMINSAIEELSEIIPNAQQDKFARSNVLRLAIEYIKELQVEAHNLRSENETLKNPQTLVPRLDPSKKPPTIIVNSNGQNTSQFQPTLSAGWVQEPKAPFTASYGLPASPGDQIHMTSPTGYPSPSSASYFDKPRHLSLPSQFYSHPSTPPISMGQATIDSQPDSMMHNHYHTRHMSIPNVSLPNPGLAPPMPAHSGFHSAPSSPSDASQHRHSSYFSQ